MTTIYDVAAKAGVSPATVSRVFNGTKVRDDKAEAVRAAAAELGFMPNQNARRLRTRRSALIAMMIPDIANPFFTTMIKAVESVARQAGFSIMLCDTDDDPVREGDYLRAVVGEPVAGIIIAPSPGTPLSIATERGVPVVCVDRTAPGFAVDSVVADNRAAGCHAADLLFQQGFKRVGCITGLEGIETADQRFQGWQDAVVRATQSLPDPALIQRRPYTLEGGEAGMRALLDLDNPPDAVFAANNMLAIGSIRVLFERDLLPPTTGVASLGELPLVTWTPREVVVTHLPARELGEVSAQLLLDRINGLDVPPRHVVIPSVVTDDQSALAAERQTA